ncbi:TIGR02186 family protein [uncultured Jannaschia sp.]|uniref:TIGR02186 family protein n=1 Tax=uncultured Jannaschia sp. TaxID=293347 RepID=UPI00262420B7|nr:TIGR02186 family protein [uncultured Jannaschia sp.]
MIRALLLFLAIAVPGRAEEIVADLSQDRVSISTNFDGSEILIFGAIRRDAPRSFDSKMSIVITVEGPREDVTVRRKNRVLGIWVNADSVEMENVPSFYAVASSRPLAEALSAEEDLRWRITTRRALTAPERMRLARWEPQFLNALVRVNTAAGAYTTSEDGVDLREGTLFSTSIALPASLTEGNYTTRIYLTRDGRVTDSHATALYVQKVGLERFLYVLAHEQPLIYGCLSLLIAIAAGWGASAIFRYTRL